MRRDFQRFPEISEISERFRGISRQVYEISVSDGPLGPAITVFGPLRLRHVNDSVAMNFS